MGKTISVRVPFPKKIAEDLIQEATNMKLSHSGYLKILIEECLVNFNESGGELSSLLNYSLGFDEYIQIYIPVSTHDKIRNLARGMDTSKICSYLVQKGRDLL